MKCSQILVGVMLHIKCRANFYPKTDNAIKRFAVPDDKVSWSIPFPDYKPVDYTADFIKKGQPWADPEIEKLQAKWNSLDGMINRVSYTGLYNINPGGYPLNPMGRTGLSGRGCLGRWGPNHAADPIVVRWKRTSEGVIETDNISNRPLLQFVAILRGDCGEWAIPGGMVDPGEVVSKTLLREFTEETLDSVGPEQLHEIQQFFKTGGTEVYRGYVDDPRNTDNSWMETVAVYFHDETGEILGNVNLKAGDDAVGVKWQDMSKDLKLYASHIQFLEQVATCLKAHW